VTACRLELEAVMDTLSAAELQDLADVARERERTTAEQRTAHLAELLWDRPALGAYRQKVRVRTFPAGAPPLPKRRKR
jgi:hypothetical protein